jgi:Rne/Rng family ribonuclease
MSKELVISAASHERRVAILEEGQLVEIYIEREKEFALVGSIYKGRVTRVLPGMQSAFVDIGLDGDAFLYVSDVFENLEDYDHGHGHSESHAYSSPASSTGTGVETLPGESLAHARATEEPAHEANGEAASPDVHDAHDAEVHPEHHREEALPGESLHGGHEHISAPGEFRAEPESHLEPGNELAQPDSADERQPESNASAPQNFGHQYNPTQKYPSRNDRQGDRNDRGGQDFGRGDRGGDRGRGGRWGRRGGRRRGGRPQGGQGRNLPPSKYASPQGDSQRSGESRGYDNRDQRGQQSRGFDQRERGFDNRRHEGSRHGAPPAGSGEEPFLLPGESLAKYRGKPSAAPSAPIAEPDLREGRQPEGLDSAQPRILGSPSLGASPSGVPRRSSGGLPRWLLAETGSEPEASSTGADELAASADDTTTAIPHTHAHEQEAREAEHSRSESSLSEEDVAALSSSLVEAKQEEITAKAPADALAGGAEFEEDVEDLEEEAPEESETNHGEEIHAASEAELEDEAEDEPEHEPEHAAEHVAGHADVEPDELTRLTPRELAEAEADAAHEDALHAISGEAHARPFENDTIEHEAEALAAAAAERGEHEASPAAEDDAVLLPGETRAPRIAGAPRDEYTPRDSARIGGNPRSRFQRPYRSGGRDRGRDRGGRPDRRGGRPGRFDRRPGGPRHDRGYQGRSGAPRRPQLISEMLKAGQDVVIQIAKEPLGKKGARITSHVALPGRFLVYMPTVHHTGVSRKIVSAENRSRLRRLVSEASHAYPGGFIVRTAAGGATDDEIRADIEFLGKTWNDIKQKSEERKAPALLHRDLDLVERMLRDYVSDDFTAIWIDNEEEYGKVVDFVSRFQPKLVSRVKLYTKETPIFEEFGIQHELDKALRAKVWLKSGGYIVINHTEALVAIDVNTGKFVGKGSTRLEDTIVKTNLEAVKEIVRQIRLRDLGGIIVVDFIDMEERRNREKVLTALQQALEQDKAPSKALSFNEFGLVCITRKRTKQALERVLCQPCPYCTGSGMVKSTPTLCYEIQAEARKMAMADQESPNLTLRVHPEIAKALKTRESMLIDELEQTTHKHVIIQSDATLHWEQYDIY